MVPTLALLAALSLVPAPATPAEPTVRVGEAAAAFAKEKGPQIDAIVREEIDGKAVPGMSVAVLVGNEIVYAKGYGFADLENEVPATEHSVYRIASVTKQFTAASILKLVEKGSVSLDDPLEKWVGGFGDAGSKVNLAHLLHHTSGIPDYTSLGKPWDDVVRLDLPPDGIMDLVRSKPLDFAPGARFEYDNSGYFLLGMVIEKVSGKPYAEFIETDLLGGLGLAEVHYGDDSVVRKHRAQGYRQGGSGWRNDEPNSMYQPYAAGSIEASAVDLARWSAALASGRVVSAKSYAIMTTPGKLNDGSDTGYGCGLTIGEPIGVREISHNGGIFGFGSKLSYYPEKGVHIAVLGNAESYDAGRVERRIARVALGLPEPKAVDLEISEDDFDACVGAYRGGPMKALVKRRGDQLFMAPEGQGEFRIKHQGGLVFFADGTTDIVIEFDRAASPAPGFLLKQNGGKLQFKRS